MAVDLYIVIVSWNVRPLLQDCLASIYASPGGQLLADGSLRVGEYGVRVGVVDNASRDDSPAMVRDMFPQVELFTSETNLGFTRGNNLVLERFVRQGPQAGDARAALPPPRYVLLLNPDTRVVGDALGCMLGYMQAHPDVGVLGPQLRFGDGSLQSSRRHFPTLMTAFMESTLLERWWPGNRWARAYRLCDTADDQIQDVDWVVGACLMTRWTAVEQVGLLDERFFMYSEELDWCRRIKGVGWRVVYYPLAQVIHYEAQSSGQVVAARHIRFDSSKVAYFAKHHGVWRAEALRLFLLATYLYQLLTEALKYALGHKRALRRERMQAYVQVLRSGLRSRGGA